MAEPCRLVAVVFEVGDLDRSLSLYRRSRDSAQKRGFQARWARHFRIGLRRRDAPGRAHRGRVYRRKSASVISAVVGVGGIVAVSLPAAIGPGNAAFRAVFILLGLVVAAWAISGKNPGLHPSDRVVAEMVDDLKARLDGATR